MLAHLIFRNVDGSFTWAGWWLIALGGFMFASAVVSIIRRRQHPLWPDRLPSWTWTAWTAFFGLVGLGFAICPFLAGDGVLY